MDCSFRGLIWIKAYNVVTAWTCQICEVCWGPTEGEFLPAHLGSNGERSPSESLLLKFDLCLIGRACGNTAKKYVPENPICSTQDVLAQVRLQVLVKGLMKSGTALWGLTGSSLPQPTDPAVRQIQLGLLCLTYSLTLLCEWQKAHFHETHVQSTYDYVPCKAHLRRIRVHLKFNVNLDCLLWYSTYYPKCSSFSLIKLRPPGGSCYMKTGNTTLPFSFVLFL